MYVIINVIIGEKIMSMIRYRPVSLLNELQKEMDGLFGRQLSTSGDDASHAAICDWSPAVDIKEEANQFILTADIPGVDPKDIEVCMDGNSIVIKGNKASESKQEEKGYSRIERFSGSFYRQFTLPDTANGNNIQAASKHGVLEITIPKVEKSQARRIEIESK